MKPARDEEGNPPGSEGSSAGSLDDIVEQGHDELGGSSAHVAPPGGGAIDEADDLAVEHGAHPVLAGDEGGEGEADHEADGDVAGGIGDEGHAEDGGGGEHDEKGAAVARAEKVADGAHDKTREDAAGDGGDAGVANVDFGEVEVITDDGDKRGGGEGGDEASEEGNPRKVEGSHVGVGEGEELEHLGLVLGVHW
ncbi:circumsporozoite protein-like [Cucurbita maxima]|uniref:Circumsporozoite protein-like n=1 Tax=Cucurbita maxima TaxID=3661 RepID=A0A6J1I2B8_CUCMA|nr:circumsporozoite protein-like [Cucurbita maxima]